MRAFSALRPPNHHPSCATEIRACRGFRQMSLRGLVKARCEWMLVCATHNLLKLWRAVTRPVTAGTAAAAA